MSNNNTKLAFQLAAFVVAMIVLAYASFPLYQLFCKVTGYGGTPGQASQPSQQVGTKTMNVRFNADTHADLKWRFEAQQLSVEVQVGKNYLAFYEAENIGDVATTGVATFNVTPEKAAQYFTKVECFCFEEQTLQPGEKVTMPVSYYIDPAIEQDKRVRDVGTVTLSYTFFKAEDTR